LRFPDAAVLVVHHFGKRQDVGTGWDAFHGSSRSSGEADVLELIKQSGEGGIAFKEIVQELGVSDETVRRYIRELQERSLFIG